MYRICFKTSPFQDFDENSLVTYRNQNLLEYIKETLYSKSNFFYICGINWKDYTCEISNGIDSIITSPDQLIEIVAYLERIEGYSDKVNKDWINQNHTYLLEDQKISIPLEKSTISSEYFELVNSAILFNDSIKKYKLVRFNESKISDLF